ncbi:MAG: phospho-N-acetylmuramoyl-pentapeptide-transferase, partial [Flavobacteriaceae bacterium]|nr:phospho-N-acetylmuramoyl-pentapeptide-transferase [Flavobacteriaceae bacterium]
MLYYLFEYIESNFQIAGASLFQYLSFRSAITFITALLISAIFGKKIINFLAEKQIGENIRMLDLPDEELKKGTPTMGGLIIILSTVIPILLFSDFKNSYVIILLVSMLWLGLIGFIDDYIKVFKKNKAGLKSSFKIAGQVILGLYIGFNVYFNPDIKIKLSSDTLIHSEQIDNLDSSGNLKTTIPFFKNNELDYEQIFDIKPDNYNWVFYVLIITFIIVSVSNGANLTDGLDGLAAGSSAIIIFTLAIFSWISGNII